MPIQVIVQRESAPIGFSPRTLNASAGDAVFWFNNDHQTEHQICPRDGAGGDWGPVIPPQSPSDQVNLPAAGEYPYRCALHDDETGLLNVT